jgi:hypothetical protein
MNTLVQLRATATLCCEVAHGERLATLDGDLGPIAVFGPERVVGYHVRTARSARLFVFRTLVVDDRLAASVPGVRPRVSLLIAVQSAGKVRRARALVRYLARQGGSASDLSDSFYVRAGQVLAGHARWDSYLRVLVRRECMPEITPAILGDGGAA